MVFDILLMLPCKLCHHVKVPIMPLQEFPKCMLNTPSEIVEALVAILMLVVFDVFDALEHSRRHHVIPQALTVSAILWPASKVLSQHPKESADFNRRCVALSLTLL